MQEAPSSRAGISLGAGRSCAALGKRSRGDDAHDAAPDFKRRWVDESWLIAQGYLEPYDDAPWLAAQGYRTDMPCGGSEPESELRMLRWLKIRNETCAEVGCNHRAALCCDVCGRRFCHVPPMPSVDTA